MARLIFWLLRLGIVALPPVLAWFGTHVVGRMPPGPFLALTPASTAIGRSLTAALLVSGSVGLAAYLSLVVGTWVLVLAMIAAAAVAVGCGRAFATFWWPAALAGSLLGMGLVLAYVPAVSPWPVVSSCRSSFGVALRSSSWPSGRPT
jgi:hypothetical protein